MRLRCLIKFDTLHDSMNAQQLESLSSTTITKSQVEDILRRTDWNAYWDEVTADAQPEIEAYRQAAVHSQARAAEHWLL
jgi:lysozyme family protein